MNQFFQGKKNIPNQLDSNKSLNSKVKLSQENSKNEEDILKKFDFDPTFGPSIGITRTDRYENAKRFGLNPSENIIYLVNKLNSDISFLDK